MLQPQHRRPAPPAGVSWPLSWLSAWREKRFTCECCHRLLKLHAEVLARHPALAGWPLYKQIVVQHVGGDLDGAEVLLQRAQESFASWPVSRDLIFRDVVHYLAVSELLARHSDTPWLQASVGRSVEAAIPRHL